MKLRTMTMVFVQAMSRHEIVKDVKTLILNGLAGAELSQCVTGCKSLLPRRRP